MDTSKHICPRCVYDLSGITDSWEDACPLTGTCSECGLTFTWFDVIRGPLRFPEWSFEHASRNRLLATFFPSLRRGLTPWRLWRDLRLETRIAPARLVLFAVFSCIALRFLGILFIGIPTAITIGTIQARWGIQTDLRLAALALLWPYRERSMWFSSDFLVSPWIALGVLLVSALPLAFFLLPTSLRRAKVRPAHILRVQLYSFAVLPLSIGAWPALTRLHTILAYVGGGLIDKLGLGWNDDAGLKIGITSLAWTVFAMLSIWIVAVRYYLRLPNPVSVAAAMTTLATLTAMLVVAVVYGPALFF